MHNSPLISMIGPDLDAMGGISSVARTWLGAEAMRGLDVHHFGTMHDTPNKAAKAALVVRRQARFVRRLASGWRPDLFHIHTSYFSSFYRKMAYFKQASATGAPVIIHIRHFP